MRISSVDELAYRDTLGKPAAARLELSNGVSLHDCHSVTCTLLYCRQGKLLCTKVQETGNGINVRIYSTTGWWRGWEGIWASNFVICISSK